MQKSKIALLDLDRSLADYAGAMRRDLALYSELEGPDFPLHWEEGLPDHIGNLINLIRQRPSWWEELEPIEEGFTILEECVKIGYEIHVLTKAPSYIPAAAAEKMTWCNKFVNPRLPGNQEAIVHISGEKSLVYGRVLFDDYEVFMDNWLEHRPRGLGIMPVNETNTDYRHPQVVRWDGTNIEEVRERLEKNFQAPF